MRVNFLLARVESFSHFAPVTTILPDEKMRAVVLGSRMRMMTAANLFQKAMTINKTRQ
jgi:hypothetical protein